MRVFGYFRHKKQLFIFRDSTADGQPPAPYGNGVLICRARINFETELHTHLRLNIPELDDLFLQADTHHREDGEFSWEFRLRPLKLSADSDAPLWIDLIFEAPRYTQTQIIDFNLSTEEGSLERSVDVASH